MTVRRLSLLVAAVLALAGCADLHQVLRGNCSAQQALAGQCAAVRHDWQPL